MKKLLVGGAVAAGLFMTTTVAGASNDVATYAKVGGHTYNVCVTNDPSSAEITNIEFGSMPNQPVEVAAPANWSFRPMFNGGFAAEWDAQVGTTAIAPGATLCGFEFSESGKPLRAAEPISLFTDGRTILITTSAIRR